MAEPVEQAFSLRRIALPAFGPSLLFGIGEGAILPVVPLTARELGASTSMAALAVALIGAGSLLSTLPASLITQQRGERRAIVLAAAWAALAFALCAGTRHLALFGLGCLMVGMSQAVFNLARQSYLTEAVPMHFRARAMSTLGGVMRIGLFIGPFIGAAAIHALGLTAAYGVGIVAVAVAGVVASRLPDLHAAGPAGAAAAAATAGPAAPPPPTLVSIFKNHRRVFLTLGVGVLLVSAVRASRQVVIPLWADHLGLTPSVAALIYGLSGGIDMLVFYPAGKLMDRKGRRWVAVPSMLIMGAALLLTPLAQTTGALLLAALVIGFGNGIGSGLIMTIGADQSPRVGRAHFLGLWRLMSDLGASAGPALLSLLAATLTLGSGIALAGVLALAAAAQLGYWIPRLGPAPPR